MLWQKLPLQLKWEREREAWAWHLAVYCYIWGGPTWLRLPCNVNGREAMPPLSMLCASCSSPSHLFTLPRPCGDWQSPREHSHQQEELHTDPSGTGPPLANISGYGPVYPNFPITCPSYSFPLTAASPTKEQMAGDASWPVLCFIALLGRWWRLKSPFNSWIVDFIALFKPDVSLYEVNRYCDVRIMGAIRAGFCLAVIIGCLSIPAAAVYVYCSRWCVCFCVRRVCARSMLCGGIPCVQTLALVFQKLHDRLLSPERQRWWILRGCLIFLHVACLRGHIRSGYNHDKSRSSIHGTAWPGKNANRCNPHKQKGEEEETEAMFEPSRSANQAFLAH